MHLCSFFSDSSMLQLSYTIIIWCLVGPSLFSISPCLLKIVLVKMAFTKKFHISPSTHAGSRLAWRMIIVARTLSTTPKPPPWWVALFAQSWIDTTTYLLICLKLHVNDTLKYDYYVTILSCDVNKSIFDAKFKHMI